MIEVKNLHKAFGKLEVLKGIDLDLPDKGRITAVIGPNGSGKTTLIKCILGMVLPDSGEIRIDGTRIRGQWLYRAHLDYLPQIAKFPDNLTVRELIECIQDIRGGETRANDLIEIFDLEAQLDKRLGHLSGGSKQKVNLTLAFMYDSPLLILDEPTSGLDPVAMVSLRDLLATAKRNGKRILITTHIMSFVEEVADEIIFLLEGKIYFRGTIQELKARYNETNVERAIAQILRGNAITTTNGNTRKEDVRESFL
jgi:Cu-processing system ATP-binding protein